MTEQILKIKIAIDAQSGQLKVVSEQLSELGETATKTSKDIESSVKTISDIATFALIKDSLLKVYNGFSNIKSAAEEFNHKMAEVSTLSNASAADIQRLKQAALELNIPFSNLQIAEALYQAQSAGVKFGNSLTFVDTASKLAVAGNADLTSATDILTSVMNSYGLSADDAARASDAVMTAVKGGKTTVKEMGGDIGKLAAGFSSAGISVEDMFAALSTVTSGGIHTAEAITYLRQAVTNIIKPSEEAQRAAKALGIEFSQAALQKDGLVGFFTKLSDATEKYSNQAEILANLFGQEAASGINQLIRNHASALKESAEAQKNNSGAMEEANAKMDTAKNASIEFGKALDGLKVNIANAFGVGEKSEMLSGLASLISKNSEGLAEFVKIAATGAASFGFLVAANTGFTALAAGIGGATAATGSFATALNMLKAHPVLLALSAITATGLFIYDGLSKEAEQTKKDIQSATDFYKQKADETASKASQQKSLITAINSAYTLGHTQQLEFLQKKYMELYADDVSGATTSNKNKTALNLDAIKKQEDAAKKTIEEAKKLAKEWAAEQSKMAEELAIKQQDEFAKPYIELDKTYKANIAKYGANASIKAEIDKNYSDQVEALNAKTVEKYEEKAKKELELQKTKTKEANDVDKWYYNTLQSLDEQKITDLQASLLAGTNMLVNARSTEEGVNENYYTADVNYLEQAAKAKKIIQEAYEANVALALARREDRYAEALDNESSIDRDSREKVLKQAVVYYEAQKNYEQSWQFIRAELEYKYAGLSAEARAARIEADRLEYLSKNNSLKGFGDSWSFAVNKMNTDWTNSNASLANGFTAVLGGMQTTMSTGFVDAMNGKVTSVGDFFSKTFDGIKASFIKMIADFASKAIIMNFVNAWKPGGNEGTGFVENLLGIDIPWLKFAGGTVWGSGNYGVVGNQKVAYDSYANDKIPALISKGEAVIPASAVAANWDLVHALISGARGNKFANGYIEKAQIDATSGVFKLKGGGILDSITSILTTASSPALALYSLFTSGNLTNAASSLWGGAKSAVGGIAGGIMPVMQTLMQNPWIGWAVQAALVGATIASGGALAPVLYPMLTADLIGFGSSMAVNNGNLYQALGSAGISGMTAGATAGIGGLINGLPPETLTFMEVVKQYPETMFNTMVDKASVIADFANNIVNPSQLADPAFLQNSPTFTDYIKNAYGVKELGEANILGAFDGTIEKVKNEAALAAYNNLGYGSFSSGTSFANGNSAFMPYDTAFSRGEWGLANYGDALNPAGNMGIVDRASDWLTNGLDYAKGLGTNALNNVMGYVQDPTKIIQYITDHIMDIVSRIETTIGSVTANPELVGVISGLGALNFVGGKETNVHAFANGGIVTSPTLGLVGEIPNRPEAIIPLEKSGQIMGIEGLSKKVDELISINVNLLKEIIKLRKQG
ncbi:MAG: hypothetical protein RL154_1593, partial [Pseudomonadota bacterium]